jgi:hypothetical protein
VRSFGTRGAALAYALGVRWAAPVVASCLVVLAACASPAPGEPPQQVTTVRVAPASQATPVAVQAVEPQQAGLSAPPVRPLPSPSPLALPLSVVAGRSGSDVRISLDLLLQEQVYLSDLAMDAAASARLDELIGISGSLDQNSMALAEIVGAVKDQAAAQTFVEAWRGLVADLTDYAQGEQTAASADLDQRRPIIATQLAIAGFSETQADELLQKRIQAELGLADALIAHDPAESMQRLKTTVVDSDTLGQPLAAGIATRMSDQAPGPTQGPAIDVRIAMTRAFQAQTYLTGSAIDAAADARSADVPSLVAAEGDTAADLGMQLRDVYGAQVGASVAERLRAETAALLTVAAGGDRQKAAADLDRLRGEIDTLLSGANPLVPAGMVKQELRASDEPLLTATDAFVARDFVTSFVRLREAARDMQKPADAVAQSIVDRYPGRYFTLATPTPHP